MNQIKLVLLDLDGTLYIGDKPIEGALEAVKSLRDMQFDIRFLTNTTTKSQTQLIYHAQSLGFEIHEEELISAPVAACLELASIEKDLDRSVSVLPLVADSILSDFSGFKRDDTHPDFIVLGDIGNTWNFELINRIFNLIHGGSELIALHKNRFWQTSEGLCVDIGFFISGFEYVTGKKARVMGKPNADLFKRVMHSAGALPHQTMMVGDDIESDIGGAQALGLKGCLVQTGKYRKHYVDQSGIEPDFQLVSIAELPSLLAKLTT